MQQTYLYEFWLEHLEGNTVVQFWGGGGDLIAINSVEILELGKYDKILFVTDCVSELLLRLHV